MSTHYLIDHNYFADKEKIQGEFGHLLAFNPGSVDADLTLTLYYEDKEPQSFQQKAPACKSTESNYGGWPIQPNTRFALKVESTQPIACQSTVGWNVTLNDYSPKAITKSPLGLRETAKSYMAITSLNTDWYVADGIVIDMPDSIYVRESEWAFLLNPGDISAKVNISLFYDHIEERTVVVQPRRLLAIYMDEIAIRNKHYGAAFHSDQPIAAQWMRTIGWYHTDELMGYWTVPCVAGPLG